MSPKEFLKGRLKDIVSSIESINIKYQYCSQYDTHIVEITPLCEYNNNVDYIAFEKNLLFDFNDLYFPATLIFVSENSLNRVDNPDFVYAKKIKESFEVSDLDNNYLISNFSEFMCSEDNFALAA